MADRPPTQPPRNVAYFFDEEVCNYNYGGGNPMRPHRHRLTTNLVKGYELDKKMRILRPEARTREEIMHFHADGAPLLLLPLVACAGSGGAAAALLAMAVQQRCGQEPSQNRASLRHGSSKVSSSCTSSLMMLLWLLVPDPVPQLSSPPPFPLATFYQPNQLSNEQTTSTS